MTIISTLYDSAFEQAKATGHFAVVSTNLDANQYKAHCEEHCKNNENTMVIDGKGLVASTNMTEFLILHLGLVSGESEHLDRNRVIKSLINSKFIFTVYNADKCRSNTLEQLAAIADAARVGMVLLCTTEFANELKTSERYRFIVNRTLTWLES
ncbi:hypothetical protein [Pseudoalteromonas piscicida]|uniref:Uncharacterized protein n=1 Tax=Pseudoalteromonas piscicida TaxID=43662 RepID=A0A2A5JLY1_PSEO7|nr:hypothetical protein [Pseudoalteromonas piscicida]PCK30435.1 hypothetical protein CEX98_17575 [Pseudoalteromonas piscicida]